MTISTTTRRHLTNERRLHITPVPPAGRSSENVELEQKLRHTFQKNGFGRLNGIEVHVDGETVTLSGAIPTYYQLQLAQTLVLPMAGERAIRNEIEII